MASVGVCHAPKGSCLEMSGCLLNLLFIFNHVCRISRMTCFIVTNWDWSCFRSHVDGAHVLYRNNNSAVVNISYVFKVSPSCAGCDVFLTWVQCENWHPNPSWAPEYHFVCIREKSFCCFGSFSGRRLLFAATRRRYTLTLAAPLLPVCCWYSELHFWLRLSGVGWHSLRGHRLIKMMTNTVAIVVTGVSGVVQASMAQNILRERSNIPSRAAHECPCWLFPLQLWIELDLSSGVNHTPAMINFVQ